MKKNYKITKRKYKITIGSRIDARYPSGTALLIMQNDNGYLWLGYEDDCIGFIDNRQLDAISKQWLKIRGYTVNKSQ